MANKYIDKEESSLKVLKQYIFQSAHRNQPKLNTASLLVKIKNLIVFTFDLTS